MFGLGGSDIGYIQCIWRYGVLGSLLLYCGYVRLLMYGSKTSRDDRKKLFGACTCVMLFIYLYKMYPFVNVGATFVILSYVLGSGLNNETAFQTQKICKTASIKK